MDARVRLDLEVQCCPHRPIRFEAQKNILKERRKGAECAWLLFLPPTETTYRRKGLFGLTAEGWSFPAEKAWQQKLETAGHIHSEEREGMDGGAETPLKTRPEVCCHGDSSRQARLTINQILPSSSLGPRLPSPQPTNLAPRFQLSFLFPFRIPSLTSLFAESLPD